MGFRRRKAATAPGRHCRRAPRRAGRRPPSRPPPPCSRPRPAAHVLRRRSSGIRPEAFRHRSCRRMEVARTAVITQPLPKFEHFVFGRRGQRPDFGPALCEPQVVVHSLRYAGLLQDHFRQPDAVRVARAAPRQVAPSRAYHSSRMGAIRRIGAVALSENERPGIRTKVVHTKRSHRMTNSHKLICRP